MDEQSRSQEQGGRMQEQAGRIQEHMRRESTKIAQLAGAGIEALSTWTDVNQRVLRELSELSLRMANESTRLYAQVQRSMIDAYTEAQATTLRCQAMWPEALTDPLRWYQRTLSETVDSTQKAFRVMDGGAQALTESVHRLQSSADQVGRSIQEAFSSAAGRVKAA